MRVQTRIGFRELLAGRQILVCTHGLTGRSEMKRSGIELGIPRCWISDVFFENRIDV